LLPDIALTDDAAVVVEPQVEAKLAATASQSLRLLLMALEEWKTKQRKSAIALAHLPRAIWEHGAS
jgi:hypothetical protein